MEWERIYFLFAGELNSWLLEPLPRQFISFLKGMVDLLHGREVFLNLGGELLNRKVQAVTKFLPIDRFNPQFFSIKSDS